MLNRKIFKSIVETKFKSFCEHSTLHGMYYFCKASSWFVYLIWVLVIALSIALCGFLGHMIWQKYVIDPTLTVVETTHYSVINIEFPAVTVCDGGVVFLPQTENITEVLELRGYNESQINKFYKSFNAVKRKEYQPEEYVKKMHAVLDDLGYSYKVLLNTFKRPCNDMIVECNWRSRPYNCSDMFRPVYTIAGHCCQFDIPYFRRHNSLETNYISGTDSSEALDITVVTSRKLFDATETNNYPMLYVFDRKDKVTLIDSYVSLIPESYFDVKVYTWAIDSSENVKELPLRSRKCILDTDVGPSAGFYQGCMTRIVLRRVVNYCRCLPFNLTYAELGVEEYSVCNWDRLTCIYEAIEIAQVDMKNIISNSECYQRCDYTQYDIEVAFVKNQRRISNFIEDASRVHVHFREMTCMKYRREILYTWDQMLANLGGVFGLCLGGSIISIIEIFWFIFELIFSIVAAYFRNPITPTEKSNKRYIETIMIKEDCRANQRKVDDFEWKRRAYIPLLGSTYK